MEDGDHRFILHHRFHGVVRACNLEQDLKNLAHGEHTAIGEKGINLSGETPRWPATNLVLKFTTCFFFAFEGGQRVCQRHVVQML